MARLTEIDVAKILRSENNVRETDARIGVQLWHGSRFPAGSGRPEDTRGELVAPSAGAGIRELTENR